MADNIFNKNRLIALINKANPTRPIPFNDTNIRFEKPVFDIKEKGFNSKIGVIGLQGTGYKGKVSVWYNRVDLSKLGTDISLYATSEFTMGDILSELNFTKGTDFIIDDFLFYDLPELSYDTLQLFTLEAVIDSLVWVGKLDIKLGRMVSSDTVNDLHQYLHMTCPSREFTYK